LFLPAALENPSEGFHMDQGSLAHFFEKRNKKKKGRKKIVIMLLCCCFLFVSGIQLWF